MTEHKPIVVEGLALLRAPFTINQISKLPKETKAQIDQRKADKSFMVWKCPECGGPHHKNAVHLDYVGHAALTDRLLDTDPAWSWEPVSFGPDGLPTLDRNGGLWIRLTVLGVTRLGYGDAEGKQGGNAIKEAIGDALRNAAMRFGAALDLWHKGDLHADETEQATARADPTSITPDQEIMLDDKMREAGVDKLKFLGRAGVQKTSHVPADKLEPMMRDLTARINKARQAQAKAAARAQADPTLDDEVQY